MAPQFCVLKQKERRGARRILTCSCWSSSGKARGEGSSGGAPSEMKRKDFHYGAFPFTWPGLQLNHQYRLPPSLCHLVGDTQGAEGNVAHFQHTEGWGAKSAGPALCKCSAVVQCSLFCAPMIPTLDKTENIQCTGKCFNKVPRHLDRQ